MKSSKTGSMFKKVAVLGIVLTLALIINTAAVQAHEDFKSFYLRVIGRDMMLDGSITFTSTTNGAILISVNGLPRSISVHSGDEVEIFFEEAETGSLRIYTNGMILAEAMSFKKIKINGVLVAEEGVIIELVNIVLDMGTICSALKITVPDASSGYTYFKFNDEELVDGISDDEIIVIKLTASEERELIIDFLAKILGSPGAYGLAATAYVNGEEVPELGLPGILGVSTIALATVLLYGKRRVFLRNR